MHFWLVHAGGPLAHRLVVARVCVNVLCNLPLHFSSASASPAMLQAPLVDRCSWGRRCATASSALLEFSPAQLKWAAL
jgi:hypothetical protein